MKIHSKWDLKGNTNTLCTHMLHNGESALNSNEAAWLKGRYMKIR